MSLPRLSLPGLSRIAFLMPQIAALFLSPQARSLPISPCAPPVGFKDSSPPSVAPLDQLVSHTEQRDINKSLDQILEEAEHTTLDQAVTKSGSLRGVSGTFPLTPGKFGEAGSRRLVCLSDGSTATEQVLERRRDQNTMRFRYVVWNYTTPKARPLVYGVGEFVYTDQGNGVTHVRWTYSFQLNRQRFPGCLGSFGGFLFRVAFLDRDYAKMMRQTLSRL